jgi:hypothetical protein
MSTEAHLSSVTAVCTLVLAVAAVTTTIISACAIHDTKQQTAQLIKATQAQAEGIAPLLQPGVTTLLRGKMLVAYTPFGATPKRADTLWVTPKRRRSRLIVPLRDSGRSVAKIIGPPVRVTNCQFEPALLAKSRKFPFDTEVTAILSAGDSDQIPFVPRFSFTYEGKARRKGAHTAYRWNFRYRDFGRAPHKGPLPTDRLLIWYTDEADQTLRWICITYRPPHGALGTKRSVIWISDASHFGEAAWPSWLSKP